jgi:hypothetical protein
MALNDYSLGLKRIHKQPTLHLGEKALTILDASMAETFLDIIRRRLSGVSDLLSSTRSIYSKYSTFVSKASVFHRKMTEGRNTAMLELKNPSLVGHLFNV